MKGRLPATEIAPLRSCCTPGARVATTIGLVLLVARKLSASLLMSSPERELSMVARLVSMTGCVAVTTTCSAVPAILSAVSTRTVWRARRVSSRTASAKPLSEVVMR